MYGEIGCALKFWLGNMRGGDFFRDLSMFVSIILKWIFKK
jgi:hypothetical protein